MCIFMLCILVHIAAGKYSAFMSARTYIDIDQYMCTCMCGTCTCNSFTMFFLGTRCMGDTTDSGC